MPQPTKPQLAIYAAFAIAVLLIGARFLRSGETGAPAGSGAADSALASGAVGAPDGASGALADPAGAGEGGGGTSGSGAGAASGADGGALAADEAAVVVDVKGAVRRPGVYRLATGARVLDAVERAGGLSGRADRRGVNLAARVTDGGEVIVPRRGERVVGGAGVVGSAGGAAAGVAGGAAVGGTAGVAGGAAAGAAGAGAGTPLALDINTATAQELELLDGVGPATAAKIVAYREQAGGFRSIEELDAVSGIGEAKLAAIRAQLGR